MQGEKAEKDLYLARYDVCGVAVYDIITYLQYIIEPAACRRKPPAQTENKLA